MIDKSVIQISKEEFQKKSEDLCELSSNEFDILMDRFCLCIKIFLYNQGIELPVQWKLFDKMSKEMKIYAEQFEKEQNKLRNI